MASKGRLDEFAEDGFGKDVGEAGLMHRNTFESQILLDAHVRQLEAPGPE